MSAHELYEACLHAGIKSFTELARRAHLNMRMVRALTAGYLPSRQVAEKVASALGRPAEELFGVMLPSHRPVPQRLRVNHPRELLDAACRLGLDRRQAAELLALFWGVEVPEDFELSREAFEEKYSKILLLRVLEGVSMDLLVFAAAAARLAKRRAYICRLKLTEGGAELYGLAVRYAPIKAFAAASGLTPMPVSNYTKIIHKGEEAGLWKVLKTDTIKPFYKKRPFNYKILLNPAPCTGISLA